MALYLARRLLDGKPLPDRAAELVVRQLATSPQEKHQRQCREILGSLPPSPTTSALYDHVLSATITIGRTDSEIESEDAPNPRVDTLVHAVEIYRLMIYQGVTPTARTRSILIRALVNAKRLDVALDVFHACMSDKMAMKSNAVGSLMTALATVGRLDDAESVETKWRTLAGKHPGTRNYDRGVVGAKALVDLMRGEDVDLDQVARKTRWKPNASFARFLERVRESEPGSLSHSVGVEPASSTVDLQVETGDQRSPSGAASAEQGSKRRIVPPTWSWINDEARPVMEERKAETRSAAPFQERLRVAGDN
jgi:pentatricopeptide repeat protein